jgi:hypothetical protein
VHLFWSSQEEKRAWLRLSMGRQPWLELELHGRRHGDLPERGEMRKEEGERGTWLGVRPGEGAPWEGAEELGPTGSVSLCTWRCSSVRKKNQK